MYLDQFKEDEWHWGGYRGDWKVIKEFNLNF